MYQTIRLESYLSDDRLDAGLVQRDRTCRSLNVVRVSKRGSMFLTSSR
jgi:hypothetical protein